MLDAARTGVGHWSEHVQAQTDANSGRISTHTMNAIFKRTRLAGPADQRRYSSARATYEDAPGCQPGAASGTIRQQLLDCRSRTKAQRSVLAAADVAMRDWQSHLADMRRSRAGHVHNAQAVWLRTWRAAPSDISAYQRSVRDFRAPRC